METARAFLESLLRETGNGRKTVKAKASNTLIRS
jgi:hypothetical protein